MSQRRSGYKQSVGGLIGALAATLLLVVGFWALTQLGGGRETNQVDTVDYSAELAGAREQAPFPVLAPTPIPSGWRATSARWDGSGPEVAWHLGLLTDDDEYVGLEQGNAPEVELLEDRTRADRPGEPVKVGDDTWRTFTSEDGEETALVLTRQGVVTIVLGTASEDELVAFAESLQ